MKNDALDVVLQQIRDEEDWQSLLEICNCGSSVQLEKLSLSGKVKFFNKEIRSNYGNTFANIFRNEYEPDYDEILKETAKKLSIKNIPVSLSIGHIENLENSIIAKVLEQAKEKIIKDKGFAAWDEIEKSAMNDIEKLYAKGKITIEEYEKLKKISLSGGLLTTIVAGRMAGFALYMVVNQIFFAISRTLGLGISVAVAGPIIGRVLSTLLGPLGWLLTAISIFYSLGDTNWPKTIGTIVFIGVMRQKQRFADRLNAD